MNNKHFYRCDRFEQKFGEGAVLKFITLLQQRNTYEQIAEEFFKTYGKKISVSQLYKYATSFIVTTVIPSEDVEKYYHRKQYELYYIEMVEKDKRFREIARQDNIIFANFLPEDENDTRTV